MLGTYITYFSIMSFLSGAWFIANSVKVDHPRKRTALNLLATISTCLCFFILFGYRTDVGGDYMGYINYFKAASVATSPDDVSYEIGFYYILKFLNWIGAREESVIAITVLIQILFIQSWIKNFYSIAPFFWILYFLSLHAFEALNIVRQATSFTIILLASSYSNFQSFWRYSTLIILASSIHISSFIFLPLFFIYKAISKLQIIKNRYFIIISILFLTIISSLIVDIVFEFFIYIAEILGMTGYAVPQEDLFFEGGAGLISPGYIYNITYTFIIIAFSKKLIEAYKNYNFELIYFFFLIGAILNPIVAASGYIALARATFTFLSFGFVCGAFLLHHLFFQKINFYVKWLIISFIILGGILMMGLAISKNAGDISPFSWGW